MIDNLNYYRVFYVVADAGSISKAAALLYISQPAVSKTITSLESTLETRLFDRISHGVRLTEQGRILYNHLKGAFNSISRAEDELSHNSKLGIGELRLGVSTSLCRYILMPHLQRFIAENPHIKVSIDCHSTYNTIRQLQEGNIDLGFICETSLPPDYIFEPFQQIHDIFVASDNYLKNLYYRENTSFHTSTESINPMTMTGNVIGFFGETEEYTPTLDEISDESINKMEVGSILEHSNLMILEKSNITRKHLDRYFMDNAINPVHLLEINNMDLLIDFASIGMGVSAVIREFVQKELADGVFRELKPAIPVPPRTVGFVYKRGLPEDSATVRFMEI